MHKNATKCNETIGKWCKNKHGASKIIDTFETYQVLGGIVLREGLSEDIIVLVESFPFFSWVLVVVSLLW
jgi:hypothetical protein